MVVTLDSFEETVTKLSQGGTYGLDTETTGLSEDDSLFSIIICGEDGAYYFNFNSYPGAALGLCLPREFLQRMVPIFENPKSIWCIHNAKFDMRMLAKAGLHLSGEIHCTYAVERVFKNNYFGDKAYRLAGLAERRGWSKDSAVEEYISKHKLYTNTSMPGKKKQIKLMHFDQVPFEVMVPYGTNDGVLHRNIALDQLKAIEELNKNTNYPPLTQILENELKLTKTCFRMERMGIKIDRPYVATALEYEMGEILKLQGGFSGMTGREFQDSNKLFQEVFDAVKEKYPKTDKGNPSFAAEVLEGMESPIASVINQIRYHEKRAGTYYSSFLHYADSTDVIHPDMRQAGTETGRFSYRDPNLQNVPKEDEEGDQKIPYHVRSSFVPRPGHFFYSVDYQQMEYRLMLDYAGETKLIDAVMGGADVHQATADLVGLSRKHAKNLNFAILYGAGIQKMAKMMGKSVKEANDLKFEYFTKLPKVHKFIRRVTKEGESRGFVYNWLGRRCHIAQRDWAYVLPNHLIQGGCADVVKVAMNRLEEYLERKFMLLQVHDELLFEVPFGKEEIISAIVGVMESVYEPYNGMQLTTSVEHSLKSWGYRDKIKGPKN